MKLIKQICEQCKYKINSSASFPCVGCCSRDRWELAETIIVNSKDVEALQQENEQLHAQVARMRNFLIETNSSSCSYCGCGNGNHGYDCELKEALSDTPAEYHNPADVAALKLAKEALKTDIERICPTIKSPNCVICKNCTALAAIEQIGGQKDAEC